MLTLLVYLTDSEARTIFLLSDDARPKPPAGETPCEELWRLGEDSYPRVEVTPRRGHGVAHPHCILTPTSMPAFRHAV